MTHHITTFGASSNCWCGSEACTQQLILLGKKAWSRCCCPSVVTSIPGILFYFPSFESKQYIVKHIESCHVGPHLHIILLQNFVPSLCHSCWLLVRHLKFKFLIASVLMTTFFALGLLWWVSLIGLSPKKLSHCAHTQTISLCT